MAQFKPVMVKDKAALENVAVVVGQYIVVTDDSELYLDTNNGRIKTSQNIYIQSENNAPTSAKKGDIWFVVE